MKHYHGKYKYTHNTTMVQHYIHGKPDTTEQLSAIHYIIQYKLLLLANEGS